MSDTEGDSDDYCSDATPSTSLTDVRSAGSEKEGCLNEARLITVDGAARMAALEAKNYTKARLYLKPFPPDAEANEWLNETVRNLTATILIDDTGSALKIHLESLDRYMDRYGLRFAKEQHCKLIKTVYGLIVRPHQQIKNVFVAAEVFVKLITGSRLTRADLTLEWRPIFDLTEQLVLDEEDHTKAVVAATAFFEKGAEREIWKRIRHYVSPATMSVAISLVSRCLPTTGYEKDDLKMKTGDVFNYHFLFILSTCWRIYEREEINVNCMDSLVGFFVRLTKDSPTAVLPFFHRHLDLIFTQLTRSLGLQDKDNVSKALWPANLYKQYGKWIGYMLETHPSVETQLMSLLSAIELHAHPSRIGTTEITRWLFVPMTKIIMKRYRRKLQAKQRKAEFKKNSIPPISESTITAYVKAMLPILEPELQSGMSNENRLDSMCTLLGELAFLRPGLVIPKILDELYSVMPPLCKPQRFTNTLAALERVLILIASDRNEHATYSDVRVPTKKDWLAERDKKKDRRTEDQVRRSMRRKRNQLRSPKQKKGSSAEKRADREDTDGERTENTHSDTEAVLSLRPHLVYIAEALVDCIDKDDCIDMYRIGMDKTIAVYEVLTLLFKVMPIVDCSQRMEPSDNCEWKEEHFLIQLSKRLEEISLRFVDKSFAIIESLKNHKDEIEVCYGDEDSTKTLRPTPDGVRETPAKSLQNCMLDAFYGICTELKDSSLRFVDKTFATIKALKKHKGKTKVCDCSRIYTKSPKILKKKTSANVLRKGILDAFRALSPEEEIGKLLCDKVLLYVSTSLPFNSNSASVVGDIISACLSDHPASIDKFLKFIIYEIGSVVDEKTQKLKHVEGRAAGLAKIAFGFCVLKKQDVHDWLGDLLGLLAMRLVACKDNGMYEAGCRCLSGLLQSLLATALLQPRADKRYKESRTPSKLWGASGDGLRTKKEWELPVKADIEAAMKILDVSLFKEMRRLAKPELMTREEVRKSLAIVKIIFASIVKFVPLPRCVKARIHHMCQNGLPSAQMHPKRAYQQLTAGEITFDGRNLRAAVCELVERLITHEKCHDSDTGGLLLDLILTLDRFHHCEYDIATDASIFDCRVTRALFNLTFFITDKGVGSYARYCAARMLDRIAHTTMRDELIDDLEKCLDAKRPELVAAVLLRDLGLTASVDIQVRARIWPLLLRIPRPEDELMLCFHNFLVQAVDMRPITARVDHLQQPYPPDYLTVVDGLLKETPRAGEWTKVGDVDAMLVAARETVKERSEKTEKMCDELAATLHAAFKALPPEERTMLGVRGGVAATCRNMILLVENQKASEETMKEIILPRILEDRPWERLTAMHNLLFWLRKNKPKTAAEGIQMTTVDGAIIDWFANRDNVKPLFKATLVDNFTLDKLSAIVETLLGNYPDAEVARLLSPLRETQKRLLAGRDINGCEDDTLKTGDDY